MWEIVRLDEVQSRRLFFFCPVGHVLLCELSRRDPGRTARHINALFRMWKLWLCALVTQVQNSQDPPTHCVLCSPAGRNWSLSGCRAQTPVWLRSLALVSLKLWLTRRSLRRKGMYSRAQTCVDPALFAQQWRRAGLNIRKSPYGTLYVGFAKDQFVFGGLGFIRGQGLSGDSAGDGDHSAPEFSAQSGMTHTLNPSRRSQDRWVCWGKLKQTSSRSGSARDALYSEWKFSTIHLFYLWGGGLRFPPN